MPDNRSTREFLQPWIPQTGAQTGTQAGTQTGTQTGLAVPNSSQQPFVWRDQRGQCNPQFCWVGRQAPQETQAMRGYQPHANSIDALFLLGGRHPRAVPCGLYERPYPLCPQSPLPLLRSTAPFHRISP
jgi:hypothetical protein